MSTLFASRFNLFAMLKSMFDYSNTINQEGKIVHLKGCGEGGVEEGWGFHKQIKGTEI